MPLLSRPRVSVSCNRALNCTTPRENGNAKHRDCKAACTSCNPSARANTCSAERGRGAIRLQSVALRNQLRQLLVCDCDWPRKSSTCRIRALCTIRSADSRPAVPAADALQFVAAPCLLAVPSPPVKQYRLVLLQANKPGRIAPVHATAPRNFFQTCREALSNPFYRSLHTRSYPDKGLEMAVVMAFRSQ